MVKNNPTLIIFAGANGSGKTTLSELFLPHAKIKEFVNGDKIAQGLWPHNSDGKKISAGKFTIQRINELLKKGESFAIESTLSGVTLSSILKKARKAGYRIEMLYMYTTDVKINLKRIKYRVKQGGHNIPSDVVRRRYKSSIYNLINLYFDLCDFIRIYDTSGSEPNPVAFKIEGDFLVVRSEEAIWKQIKKHATIKR